MSFNFPNSPIQGQTYQPADGYQYIYVGNVWRVVEGAQGLTAETRNRIVNPNFCVSQEWGNAAGTTLAYHAADQWNTYFVGTVVATSQRVQSVTPNGSLNRYRITITTADAALASSDMLFFQQKIEGTRVSDFRWGTASARQVVLRFGWKSPAGTYSFRFANSAANRSYVAQWTISAGQANTDTVQTFVVPGDTTGTWLADTGLGLYIDIVIATGSGLQGATGWQAGNFLGISTNTNGMATASAVYEIFDLGLYCDPLSTGAPPAWVAPDEAAELEVCLRYWRTNPNCLGWFGATTQCVLGGNIWPYMRGSPAINIRAGATVNQPFIANPALSSFISAAVNAANGEVQLHCVTAAASTGVLGQLYAGNLTFNNRM